MAQAQPSARPSADDSPTSRRARAVAVAEDAGAALRRGLVPVAERVGTAVKSGLGSVEHALEDPSSASGAELADQANLPELAPDDPLASMAVRLDREADFWRGVAVRQITRAAWMDRISVTFVVVAVLGEIVLAAIAGFRALFAAEHAAAASVVLGTGAVVLAAAALLTSRAAARIREGQVEIARDALHRADLAETRIHRLAVLMEMRSADREGYLAVLRTFETDARSA